MFTTPPSRPPLPSESSPAPLPGNRIGLIWAQAQSGVIGDAGGIPWHLPEDLARFKELTLGGTVVMGRRTWDSLPERFRPLAGRQNVVITRQSQWAAEGATVAHSLDDALVTAEAGPVWVIGGGEVYRQAMPLAGRIEVTEVELEASGDTVAPEVSATFGRVSATDWLTSRTGLRYRFVSYARVGNPERATG